MQYYSIKKHVMVSEELHFKISKLFFAIKIIRSKCNDSLHVVWVIIS